MNPEDIKTEEQQKELDDFNSKFDPFQGFLIGEMKKGISYKNDTERHLKEANMASEYGKKFREIALNNPEIKFSIISGDFETAAEKIMDILHIKAA